MTLGQHPLVPLVEHVTHVGSVPILGPPPSLLECLGQYAQEPPHCPGYTATGALPGLEVPFVSRGLPLRIRFMASSTYGERASPSAPRAREGL